MYQILPYLKKEPQDLTTTIDKNSKLGTTEEDTDVSEDEVPLGRDSSAGGT
mgnify:CR=1 FL=1